MRLPSLVRSTIRDYRRAKFPFSSFRRNALQGTSRFQSEARRIWSKTPARQIPKIRGTINLMAEFTRQWADPCLPQPISSIGEQGGDP
jgi:hypothetical protein